MKNIFTKAVSSVLFSSLLCCGLALGEKGKNKPDKKDKSDEWSSSEYSGIRTHKNLRAAMLSKGFSWLSGSPADNEKLSIGKNAQFFGFVALRGESGRAANRGILGRAFFAISDDKQKEILTKAVLAEDEPLKNWWKTRETILRIFENHLYNGEPIDEEKTIKAGKEFCKLGGIVAIHEARAYAALEDTLTEDQLGKIKAWRIDPETAQEFGDGGRVESGKLTREQAKQLEDLFAKAFSWLTGKPEDNLVIPLGQPAQFFGFVAVRHQSGHAASRGKIAKSFRDILSASQLEMVDAAIAEQIPVVNNFTDERAKFLDQLELLRTDADKFDEALALEIAEKMGALEAEAGWIEAKVYRKIRESMSDEQTKLMMKLRGDYVLDDKQVEALTLNQRGEQLAILCSACHGATGAMAGPELEGMFDRPIASVDTYEYSSAMKKHSADGPWTAEKLDEFLANPKAFAPGTKMEFQGLLNAEDRKAIINYYKVK